MIKLDGTAGEGGGQILRTAIGLSLATGEPFRIERIRGRRPRPGLLRQHLTAVEAGARIGDAEILGAALGSTALEFRPRRLVPGDHHFAVGTAGSTTLVLQAVLPALLRAKRRSSVRITGGTHNPFAPTAEFLERAFLPVLARMGGAVEARLERFGFYPAGGGAMTFTIEPASRLEPLDLCERGALRGGALTAVVARLPASIAHREVETARRALGWPVEACSIRTVESDGPGNAVLVELDFERVTELFSAIGRRGRPAERVAIDAAEQALAFSRSEAPVGPHLADQLLVPLALAGEGRFLTSEPTAHCRTNAEVIRAFLGTTPRFRRLGHDTWEVRL